MVLFSFASVSSGWAAYGDDVEVSTNPIGSPFFRHLANQYNLELKELVKLEDRGFGRTETITLILISSATGKYFKDLAKRRLKEKIHLKDLAEEAQLNYGLISLQAQEIKTSIEAKGDRNLPPPVFATPSPTPAPVKKEKKDKKKKPTKEKKIEERPEPL